MGMTSHGRVAWQPTSDDENSWPCSAARRSRGRSWARADAVTRRRTWGSRVGSHANQGSCCVLELEVGHALSSNSVRARNCPVCGGIWRHFVARKVRFWAVPPAVVASVEGQASGTAATAAGNAAAQAPTATRAPTVVAQSSPPSPWPAFSPPSCSNPNALGIARVVEIDTTGGPGFGFEHFKSHDFLREGEVVLTFDDGPWPKNTQAVLAALAAHCTKAIFFPIGLHATYEPGILKQVAAAGHAIGSHTWCHQDLSKTKGRCNVN